MSLCPNFHAPCSRIIHKQWLPAGLGFYQTFPIRVTQVVTPSSFWFQLQDQSYIDRLQDLEGNMNAHYNNGPQENFYFSSLDAIEDAGYAAVVVNDRIRRARVTRLEEFGDHQMANVFHVDYGTRTMEDCDTLMKLERKFYFLPQQAICASLANAIPADGSGRWTGDDSTRFEFMCRDKILEAQAVSVFRPKLKLFLVLNDITNRPVEINIRDALIENGIAVPGPTIC